ncbi:hypothetical protein TRFO_20531 [Tritrichomonas foetus]|uniref:Uncharacterized protein n=1 Tax=Tritrichomonas foetus TaxID=1144522 RepID=A0A1J4KH02_9EUKA|nr:hypothetical protein TRFO_20531 [Tritrichomonas foetus]|eukprot:OHT10232.1 hypothetical protein TRFO_20531 [Tritrichomonas foetus]
MITKKDLHKIINRFDTILQDQPQTKQQRQAFAHQIDEFIKRYSEKPPTPKVKLLEAKETLSQCNLPLTNYIFLQETKLTGERYKQKSPLSLSPSVAVSIVSQKKKYRTIPTQFDSIDHEKTARLANKMIESLQAIRDDIQIIAEKHQKHKEKQRKIQFILQQIRSYDPYF